MKKMIRHMAVLCAITSCAFPAAAWGPQAESAVVTTAARVLAKENAIPLTNLLKDVRAGAEISTAEMFELIPKAGSDQVAAILSEMALLEAVRDKRVDPYYAFRLGVLGKLVAQLSAPMQTAHPSVKTLYLADVERRVGQATLTPEPRRQANSAAYFSQIKREATARQDLIEEDYRKGVGFAGIASKCLSEDVSRSVASIADVWYTLLSTGVQGGPVSPDLVRGYYLKALDYYIAKRHTREATATYARLKDIGAMTTEVKKQVGDMFFDTGQYERAIQEYQAVLQEDAGRRDVIDRVTGYYIGLGEKALDRERLEEAQDAFQMAAQTDPLNESAQENLINTKRLIADREERRSQAQAAVDTAKELERQAETPMLDVRAAMEMIEKAKTLYEGVTDEFPLQSNAAERGLASVTRRYAELRSQLLSNVANFSGAGSSADALTVAQQKTGALAKDALREMARDSYEAQRKSVAEEVRKALAEKAAD